ncbi:MAG: TfoX/Sxy family protein [Rubrivivax sp.]
MHTASLVDHCIELLSPLGSVRAKRMFGGHGLYLDDLFIAIIAFDRLFLKTNAELRPHFEAEGCEPFVYDRQNNAVALGYWSAPAEAMESPALMAPWARLAVQAALAAKAAKPAAKPRVKPRAAPARKRGPRPAR